MCLSVETDLFCVWQGLGFTKNVNAFCKNINCNHFSFSKPESIAYILLMVYILEFTATICSHLEHLPPTLTYGDLWENRFYIPCNLLFFFGTRMSCTALWSMECVFKNRFKTTAKDILTLTFYSGILKPVGECKFGRICKLSYKVTNSFAVICLWC